MPPSKKPPCFWSVLPFYSLFSQYFLDTFVKKDRILRVLALFFTHILEGFSAPRQTLMIDFTALC